MGKTPNWIRRRISQRPAARWISWESGRPGEAPANEPTPQVERRIQDAGNVVSFRRSA